MAKEEKRNLGAEALFERAMQEAAKRDTVGYLGDPGTLRSVLLLAVERAFKAQEKPDPTKEIEIILARTAYMLLGRGQVTHPGPVHGWNEPGKIDEFLAAHLGLPETDPFERCKHATLLMLRECQDIEEFANEPGVKDEQWVEAAEAVIEKYTNLFMGIPPAVQHRL